MVCVDIALFERRTSSDRGILLIQRGKEPFAGCWALPGGFVEMDEDLGVAARRELREETDVQTGELIQVGAFGDPRRDPRGRNISVTYAAVTSEEITPVAGDDAVHASVFALANLPPLAFDHDCLIRSAIDVLKLHQKW
jgi:8-oxo-dGTP diphosphatase